MTSAVAHSCRNSRSPASDFRSSRTLRIPRPAPYAKNGGSICLPSGASTLVTLAPRSRSAAVHRDAGPTVERSRTETPWSTPERYLTVRQIRKGSRGLAANQSGMRMRLAALLVVLGLTGALLPAGHSSAACPADHRGRWLTDQYGRVVILHGVNMTNKLPPYDPAKL